MITFVDPETETTLHRDGDFLVSDSGARYPVVDGIPRFVTSEQYSDSFGLEWYQHSKTQLDSHTRTKISQQRLERCLGYPVEGLAGKTVLEAGCGAGRFTEILVSSQASVHAIDMSRAVEVNRDNIGNRANYVVAQADLLNPPLPPESFDLVLCLGVLQHTPSPDETIAALWRMVKPRGMLVVDQYVWEMSRLTQLDWIYRLAVKQLPVPLAKRVTDRLTALFFPLHWRVRKNRAVQAVLSRFSPLYTYMHAYPQLSRQDHFEWARLDAFDHLRDRYKRLTTPGRMTAQIRALEPASFGVWRGGNGVEARAVKRARG